ncbi:hypothetical protein [Marinifilum flexuosum]|uniref:Uncharacterized protein n=1 Tax=Marinifilum flexuosum TaxID=1117708 RepID=A0A419WMT6_9BACT|nr:hypothetical protein [Marinifilum flexuosum]RKD96752.1 hypothetical protein BXY64_3698 [Marinifilum flexuosum]
MTKEEFKKSLGELWLDLKLSDKELERFCEITDKIYENAFMGGLGSKQTIVCPECNLVQVGTIQKTLPFPTFIHECDKCGHIIMESEWQEAKTLHLNLKKQWFELIKSGEKKEEYREISEYWNNRFASMLCDFEMSEVKTITFSNGYSKDRPQFEIELKGIFIREGKEEWGAEPNKKYYVLKLGKLYPVGNTE